MDVTELREVKFDLSTLTIGEAAEAERASGWALSELLKSRSAIRLLGLFVHVYRSSGRTPSWSELSSLRVLDVSPSTSRPPGDGDPVTSQS